MEEIILEIGKSYFVTRGDFITKKIIKTRKDWKFQGTQKGGSLNMLYYIFSRNTQRTYREMAIPEYLLRKVKEV